MCELTNAGASVPKGHLCRMNKTSLQPKLSVVYPTKLSVVYPNSLSVRLPTQPLKLVFLLCLRLLDYFKHHKVTMKKGSDILKT